MATTRSADLRVLRVCRFADFQVGRANDLHHRPNLQTFYASISDFGSASLALLPRYRQAQPPWK